MKTQTETVYLHIVTHEKHEPFFTISTTDMATVDSYTTVDTKAITFDLPEVQDCTDAIVKGLQEQREVMVATAAAAITEIDNRIASFLALENDSG